MRRCGRSRVRPESGDETPPRRRSAARLRVCPTPQGKRELCHVHSNHLIHANPNLVSLDDAKGKPRVLQHNADVENIDVICGAEPDPASRQGCSSHVVHCAVQRELARISIQVEDAVCASMRGPGINASVWAQELDVNVEAWVGCDGRRKAVHLAQGEGGGDGTPR